MPGTHTAHSSDLIRWLLDPADPPVRYVALRRLLERGEEDPEVAAARAAIAHSPLVERIFRRQAPGGWWGDPASPYQPKYKGTYWTLMVLGHLGLSREDERVRRAVEYLFGFQQPDGGFPEAGPEGARRAYAHVAERRRARGQEPPAEAAFVADHIHQVTYSCLTGKVAAALLRLGYGDGPRLWRAVEWLASVQNADGGWLCPYWRAHVRDRHGCFHGTIAALEAFAEVPEERRSPAVQQAAVRGCEFLLAHCLYRADRHGYEVINHHWLELSFPWLGYDILYGLYVLTRLGCRDERMADALGVLAAKRAADGKWLLESTPEGRLQAGLGRRGEPNKWVTLNALYVLDRQGLLP